MLGIVLLLAASQLAVGMVNWLATLLVTPRPLPRMDFSKGLPPQSRTLVVVPTLLTSAEGIESLVEALEVRFLANRDDNLHFGLLTDFADAPAETLPSDEALLALARKGIEDLNDKYGEAANATLSGATGGSFFLFHRPRRWNAREGVWMGHERKRGKLADLNAFLRGGGNDRFSARRRKDRRAIGREVRDHARHRHAVAARVGATVRRRDGASAEPPALRQARGQAVS